MTMETRLSTQDWRLHARALRRLAVELLSEEDLADDVVQSALLAAVDRPPARLTLTWMRAVVRNAARDLHRRRGARSHEPLDERSAVSEPQGSDPADIAERIDTQERLSASVGRLAEPYRSTVYLRYFEERSPREIAASTGVPEATVKTRLRRGLDQLRAEMERGSGDARDWRRGLALFALRGADPTPLRPTAITLATAGGLLMWKKLMLVLSVALLGWGLAHWSRGDVAEPLTEVAALTRTDELADPAPESMSPPVPSVAVEREEARAERAELPEVERGALRARVLWTDGSPAEGVVVSLIDARQAQSVRVPERGILQAVSDGDGFVEARDVRPGSFLLRADRGAQTPVEIEPGVTWTGALTLDRGADVSGLVVDPSGRPVPAAEIWLTTGYRNWLSGHPVARTDAHGRFALRDCPREQSLGAVASGFGPSALVDLELVGRRAGPLRSSSL